MEFTVKERKAIQVIRDNNDICDNGECWAQPSDLINNGYSQHETAGLFSALMSKGILSLREERPKWDGGDLYVLDFWIVEDAKPF